MSAVQIVQKKVNANGRSLLVQLLRMGDQEGLLANQVMDVLGVGKSNISQVLSRNGIGKFTLSKQTVLNLRKLGLISAVGRPPAFLTKEAIKEIIWYVGTPEAKAIYYQLWETLENPNQYVAVQTEAKGLAFLDQMQALIDRARELEIQNSKLTQENKTLGTNVFALKKGVELREKALERQNEVLSDYADEPITPMQLQRLKQIARDKAQGIINKEKAYSTFYWAVFTAAKANSLKNIRQRNFHLALDIATRFEFSDRFARYQGTK